MAAWGKTDVKSCDAIIPLIRRDLPLATHAAILQEVNKLVARPRSNTTCSRQPDNAGAGHLA